MSDANVEKSKRQKVETKKRTWSADDFEVITHEKQTARRCRKCKSVLPGEQRASEHKCKQTSKSPNVKTSKRADG